MSLFDKLKDEATKKILLKYLKKNKNCVSQTAKELQCDRRNMFRLMKRLGLKVILNKSRQIRKKGKGGIWLIPILNHR